MRSFLFTLVLLATAVPLLQAQTPTKHWTLDALPITETISGTVATVLTGTPQLTTGVIGGGVLLDSTMVDLGEVINPTDARLTLMLWFREGNTFDSSGSIFNQTNPDAVNNYTDGVSVGGEIIHDGPSLSTPGYFSNNYYLGNFTGWRHVALVFDTVARTGKTYVNGNLIGTYNYTSTDIMLNHMAGTSAYIGGDSLGFGGPTLYEYFSNGFVDDIRYYTDTLSQAQIMAAAGVGNCGWNVGFTGIFVPGQTSYAALTILNSGSIAQSGTLWLVWPNDSLNLLNFNQAPTITNGDTFFFDVNNLAQLDWYGVQCSTTTDTNAVVGNWHPVSYGFISDSNCTSGPLTQAEYKDSVVVLGSYDPNDKAANTPNTLPGEWITYTVRFQNTGSFAAYRVILRDTISNLLDFSTIRIAGTSHEMYPVFNDAEKIVSFVYNPIYLPDSTSNPAGSQGFVTFRVQVDAGFTSLDTIRNRAGIFFDFNPVVLTNTVATPYRVATLGFAVGSNVNSKLRLWPNPAGNVLNVAFTENTVPSAVRVLDMQGRLVLTLSAATETTVDVSSLVPGLYTLVAETAKGTAAQRFVVSH
jgi:uncharacterized repeat protein (TIGR01451 family)